MRLCEKHLRKAVFLAETQRTRKGAEDRFDGSPARDLLEREAGFSLTLGVLGPPRLVR